MRYLPLEFITAVKETVMGFFKWSNDTLKDANVGNSIEDIQIINSNNKNDNNIYIYCILIIFFVALVVGISIVFS